MKLFIGKIGNDYCEFMGKILVCNNPYIFEYLRDVENDKIKRFNRTNAMAEQMFGIPMKMKEEIEVISYEELDIEQIQKMFE